MPVAAIAGVGSALIGASSASKAAKAQSRAAEQQMQLQREMYDQTREDLGGYRDAGSTALQALMYEMGLGAAPTVGGTAPQIETVTTPADGGGSILGLLKAVYGGDTGELGLLNALYRGYGGETYGGGTSGGTQYRVGGQTFNTLEDAQAWARANPTGGSAYGGFTATPGYEFRLQSGNESINALAGARGGLNSGATLKALADYNQNIASEEYGNYLNRLAGLTDMGASAASGQAGANNALAQMGSNSLAQKGNAQSAGAIGIGNALQGGLQTGIGLWNYQNNLNNGLKPAGWT
ncbi:hypothetical protein [Paracoccus versutus]|uniref:DNA transfer protein p32 n=1 Tax=Paracoccus versutus TaxID=34007 RepID=A0A3D9XRZ6_PARVE|nr:hypothetical protein [Paracoccus versutus]REF72388.1 hypothetical protein BDD41_0858 [Paracoccus versutus]WGR55638.1 hypothetical protein E3U25_06560 [Paracoccus versutus]